MPERADVSTGEVRVLVDLSVAPPGGAGTYATGFLRGLVEGTIADREALTVLVERTWAEDHAELLEAVAARGSTVETLDLPTPGTWKARLGRGRVIARAVQANAVDVAYCPREVVPRLRVPFALLAHNLHAWTRYETSAPTRGALSAFLLRRMARRSADRAGAVLVVSEAMINVMDPAVPISAVVHHGCSLPEGLPRAPSVDRDAPRRVMMLCTLMANKRVEVIIEGVARAKETAGTWTLDVYGGIGEATYAAELERLSASRLGASVLRGAIPPAERARTYQQADILAVGGTFESFCFPLIEGMRSGCVVVAPQGPLTQELCGDAAVTYVEGNPTSFAEALERAWADRDALSSSGVDRARRYTWAAATEQAIEVTRSVVDVPKRDVGSRSA